MLHFLDLRPKAQKLFNIKLLLVFDPCVLVSFSITITSTNSFEHAHDSMRFE